MRCAPLVWPERRAGTLPRGSADPARLGAAHHHWDFVMFEISGPHEAILEGLTDRVRTLLRALDRQDRLETAQAFLGWLEQQAKEGRLPDAARELFLRALRIGSDTVNYRILQALDPSLAVELPLLMARTGLDRVAASERVNDLVQVGLATRDLVGDQIRGTPLAAGLVRLIEGLASQAGERLRRALAELPG